MIRFTVFHSSPFARKAQDRGPAQTAVLGRHCFPAHRQRNKDDASFLTM
jgi:hypothetical protein